MVSPQQGLKGFAGAIGFFFGALLLGMFVRTRIASAQCGPAGPNTACGTGALAHNTTGTFDSAFGFNALFQNTTGSANTASGVAALLNNTTGFFNIGLGFYAGFNIVAGSNNIDIGGYGSTDESNTIRIGNQGARRKNRYCRD